MPNTTYPNQGPSSPLTHIFIKTSIFFLGFLGTFIGVLAIYLSLYQISSECLPFAIFSELIQKYTNI